MNAIIVIAGNTFRQIVRQRLFMNVILFGLGMVLFGMVVGNLTFGFPDRVVRSIGLSGLALALDLIALLVGISLVHQEIAQKTLFVVLTRPIRRWQYVAGRYLGLLGALAVAQVGLAILFFLILLAVGGTPTRLDFMAIAAGLPEAAVLAGAGIVLSSFSTPTLSTGIGLGFWIAAASTDDLVRLTASDPATQQIAKVVYYVFPSLARFNFRFNATYQIDLAFTDFLSSFAYGAAYSVFLVAAAGMILTRREMV